MRLLGALIACSLLLVGCSTHEERFEGDASEPVNIDKGRLLKRTADLITAPSRRSASLPSDALAPLAAAAAEYHEASGSARGRELAKLYADALLKRKLEMDDGIAFADAARPRRPDAAATARAGLALLDVAAATTEGRYRESGREVARAMRSYELGWRVRGNRAEVLTTVRPRHRSIGNTSLGFAVASRAAKEAGLDSAADARLALETVSNEQAAVGRWYAYIGRPRQPMSLDQWTTTLTGLAEGDGGEGYLPTGGAALAEASFDDDGTLKRAPFVRDAPPVARARLYGLLALLNDSVVNGRAFHQLLDDFDSAGPLAAAFKADDAALAEIALALARELRAANE